MSTDWDEVEGIFADAIGTDPRHRSVLLDRCCAGLPAVRVEVESLLFAHARAGQFITPVTLAPGPQIGWHDASLVGDMIGPYRLEERVGEGGMSVVYRATRVDTPCNRRVAIKLIVAPPVLAAEGHRVHPERQILAALRHPNIVTLLGGGSTEAGVAYLVMEYVDGSPITTFCGKHRLSFPARLRLIRRVCSAVHHAHRHGVVHCDIKPGNVFVTSRGVAKVLDFGVARLLDGRAGGSFATWSEQPFGLMTPNYASPEQLRGEPITTSTDIYSLGVLLYEILTGTRPYDTTGLAFDDVRRLVVDTEPIRPSLAGQPTREILPYDARRVLEGELDTLVLRAMDKVRELRYATAEALAEDIGRFLGAARDREA